MQTFLEQAAADIQKKYPEGYQDLAIVFNNKRPISFLKNYLAKGSNAPFWSPQFFTVEEFIAQFSPYPLASDLQQFFLLHESYNELLAQEELPAIDQSKFFPLAEILLRDFAQLDMNLADPDSIFTYLRDLAVIEEQFPSLNEEQQDFLERFWSSFATENQAAVQRNFIQLWERLPLLYRLFEKKLDSLNLSTLGLTYKYLAQGKWKDDLLISKYKKILFIGFNAINNSEAMLFKRWQASGKAVFYFDGDAYYFEDILQEAGLFLRKNLKKFHLKNELGDFPDLLNNPEKEIEIFPVDGDIAQAKSLHLFLKDEAVEEHQSFSKKAIILADEQLIIPVLQSIPNNLPINVTMGFPLNQSSVYTWLSLWLDIQKSYHHHQDEKISIPHLHAYESIFSSGSGAGTSSSVEDFKESGLKNIDFKELDSSMKSFFRKGSDSLEMVSFLNEFILEVLERKEESNELFQIESSLLLNIHQILNQMQSSLMQLTQPLDAGVCLAFLNKYLNTVAAPLEGFPLNGIQVMGVLESRNLDFEEVIILGANEGHFPKSGSSVTLIPDALRRAYDLPVLENQDAVSAYLFYRLLQRSKKVKIVYNKIINQNSSGEPSRFLQQIQFEADLKFKISPQTQPIVFSGKDTAAIKIQKTPEVMARLRELYIDKKMAFSASALRLYMDCPLRFFLKYVAHIPEKEEEITMMDARNFGNVLHRVLEDFYNEFLGKIIAKKDLAAKENQLRNYCLSALAKELRAAEINENDLDAEQKILLALVEDYARIIINHDKKYHTIQLLELENKTSYQVPVPIQLEGKTEYIYINIISDRIDIADGKRRIVDYKTGGDSLEFNSLENLFDREKIGNRDKNPAAFQALLYAYVYDKKMNYDAISPHLYIARQISKDGASHLSGKITGNSLEPIEHFSLVKEEFELRLIQLIEEIFDPEIPFEHNPHALYCSYTDYAAFCSLGADK